MGTCVQKRMLQSLANRASFPRSIIEQLATLLSSHDPDVRRTAAEAPGERMTLPDEILNGVAALLKDEDWYVR